MRTRLLSLAVTTPLLLAACSGTDAPPPPTAASTSPSPQSSPEPTAPAASPSPSPSPAGGEGQGIVLGGARLGVTMLGAPFAEAVAAVTTVLGEPSESPATGVSCLPSRSEVQWEGFRLAEGEGGVAAGWLSSSRTLQTPSGVTVGTDLATLARVYGAGLRVYPPNTDNSRRTFEVQDADVLGGLTDDDTVESIYSSFCSGP